MSVVHMSLGTKGNNKGCNFRFTSITRTASATDGLFVCMLAVVSPKPHSLFGKRLDVVLALPLFLSATPVSPERTGLGGVCARISRMGLPPHRHKA